MTKEIFQKIETYCVEKQLLKCGDGIVTGVSGGADSVFLLYALKYLQERWELKLCAVHINHGIRGDEALRDQYFTQELCKKLGVECLVFQKDIPALAKEQQQSEEEAGRIYRYQCFEQVRQDNGYQKIAVAHHQDDQAETILFQLVRGSGLRGMGGMHPIRERIIRPLLSVSRKEIENVLIQQGITYCTDSTNASKQYTRNVIRHDVIPYIQENIQKEAVSHICSTGDILREVWEYLEEQVTKVYNAMVTTSEACYTLGEDMFLVQPAIIQKELILRMIEGLSGKRKDITKEHICLVQKIFLGNTGKKVSLPYELVAEKSYKTLILKKKKETVRTETEHIESEVRLGENYTIPIGGNMKKEYYFSLENNGKKSDVIDKKNYTKCFDYDRMKSMPVFRRAKDGDFICLSREGAKKKLSRIFIDDKVPLEQRKDTLVLAIGQHVLWVPKLNRCSAYYYIGEDTKEVLVARVCEKEEP